MFWLQVTLPESRTFGCMVNTKGPHGMLSWNISIQGNSVVRCVCACVLFHHYGAPKGHQNCLFHTLWVNLDTVIGNTCSTSSKSMSQTWSVCLFANCKIINREHCGSSFSPYFHNTRAQCLPENKWKLDCFCYYLFLCPEITGCLPRLDPRFFPGFLEICKIFLWELFSQIFQFFHRVLLFYQITIIITCCCHYNCFGVFLLNNK